MEFEKGSFEAKKGAAAGMSGGRKIEKLRFKLRRMKTPFETVDAGVFVGFVRGLTKLTCCKVFSTIEDKSTEEFFIIDVQPLKTSEKWIDFAKRQAESYGVIVEVIEEAGG